MKSHPSDNFCNAYGVIGGSEELVHAGDHIILDHSWRERDPCGDDDLWHYTDLGVADGVLFDDCTVSWDHGGWRTDAEDLGIPCTPASR